MWIRDCLPLDLPGVRILVYGYDSHLSKSESFQSITSIANQFLDSLHAVRVSRMVVVSQCWSNARVVLFKLLFHSYTIPPLILSIDWQPEETHHFSGSQPWRSDCQTSMRITSIPAFGRHRQDRRATTDKPLDSFIKCIVRMFKHSEIYQSLALLRCSVSGNEHSDSPSNGRGSTKSDIPGVAR